MAEPFLGEIKIVGFTFPPSGWANCDGQLLPIAQNTALFSLLGTFYGGDGRTSFGVPELRGRAARHTSNFSDLGDRLGQESVTLTQAQMPAHNHLLTGVSGDATSTDPAGQNLARAAEAIYESRSNTTMAADALGNSGENQPHNNMQPFLALNFCIALQGLFPSRN